MVSQLATDLAQEPLCLTDNLARASEQEGKERQYHTKAKNGQKAQIIRECLC